MSFCAMAISQLFVISTCHLDVTSCSHSAIKVVEITIKEFLGKIYYV